MFTGTDYGRINELILEFAAKHNAKESDINVQVFPQVWGSTALGFDGIGGQAFTKSHTIVLYSAHHDIAWVAFAGSFAYEVTKPNGVFWEDKNMGDMKPQRMAYQYNTIK